MFCATGTGVAHNHKAWTFLLSCADPCVLSPFQNVSPPPPPPDSGSMAFEENGERIDDLKMIAQKVGGGLERLRTMSGV
jgi:hypothetical protein